MTTILFYGATQNAQPQKVSLMKKLLKKNMIL